MLSRYSFTIRQAGNPTKGNRRAGEFVQRDFLEIEKEGASGAVPGQYVPTASPDKDGYAVQLIEHSLGRRAYVFPLTGAFDHWLTQRQARYPSWLRRCACMMLQSITHARLKTKTSRINDYQAATHSNTAADMPRCHRTLDVPPARRDGGRHQWQTSAMALLQLTVPIPDETAP
jgi:hypothetical protein